MNKLFIPYELALLAKEKRFNEPCLGLYHSDGLFVIQQNISHSQYYGQICSAPIYQQIISHLNNKGRELGINIYITFDGLNLQETNKQIFEALNLL